METSGSQQSALQTMRPGQTYIGCLPEATECTPKAGHPCMTVNISSRTWGKNPGVLAVSTSYEPGALSASDGARSEVQFLIQGCIMNPGRCGLVKELLDPEYQINITCCSHASFCNDLGPAAPSKGGR
ncbi:unnamed protein product [Lepidochelys kempii]